LNIPPVFLTPAHNAPLRQPQPKTTEGLTLDVITVPQTTKLLLSGSVPRREHDRTKVGVKLDRVDFDTEGGWMTASKEKHEKKTTNIKRDVSSERESFFVRSGPPQENSKEKWIEKRFRFVPFVPYRPVLSNPQHAPSRFPTRPLVHHFFHPTRENFSTIIQDPNDFQRRTRSSISCRSVFLSFCCCFV
jgi:hypothetical protein